MASADIDENVDSNHYQHNKEYSLETESESNIDDQKDEVIMIVGIYLGLSTCLMSVLHCNPVYIPFILLCKAKRQYLIT